MKAIIAVLAGGLLVMAGAAWAQPEGPDPLEGKNCIKFTHSNAIGDGKTETVEIEKMPTPLDWSTRPAIFVHEEYKGRGTCTLNSMDCWVSEHDIIWIKPEDEQQVLSRKRGSQLSFPEYDAPLKVGLRGRFAFASVPALGSQPPRQIFLLPLKSGECPAGWYPGGPHECRYFRVEVFNQSGTAADQEANKESPELEANWIDCETERSLAGETDRGGSAHEPPKDP